MEKTQAGSRRYPRNSERAQDDRAVKWRAVDGKLLLDPGKKAVYSSYIPGDDCMLKILIIEILLSVVLGAILYRLVWALTRSKAASWAGILAASIIIMIFVPGHIDETLIVEYGGKLPVAHDLSPFVVNLLRCLGLIIGAGLASLAVAARKRIGLEDKPPYKDFP